MPTSYLPTMAAPPAPALPETICEEASSRARFQAGIEDFLSEMVVSCSGASRVQIEAGQAVRLPVDTASVFVFIADGEAILQQDRQRQEAGPGDLLHLARGTECVLRAPAGRGAEIIVVHFVATISESIDVSELLDLPLALAVGVGSRVHYYLAESAAVAESAVGRRHCLRSLITLVLLSLVCDYLPEAERLLRRPRVVQMRRLLPAVRVLRRDMSAASSIDVLAQRCGLSVAQFRRLFHEVFERSPTQYIQQMRVREACRLLHCTDRTVNEICLQIGYEQPSHFHKTFKKFTGVTPRFYREELESRHAI